MKNCEITYHSGKLVLHLSLDDFTGLSKEDAISSIMNTIRTGVEGRYLPDIINIVKELPRTSVGKVDYRLLNDIGNKLCEKYSQTDKLKIVKDI